jgi:hypothetical protein
MRAPRVPYCNSCRNQANEDLDRVIRGELTIYDLPFDVRAWILFGTLRGWNG